MTDRDRALALAERIAEAWGIGTLRQTSPRTWVANRGVGSNAAESVEVLDVLALNAGWCCFPVTLTMRHDLVSIRVYLDTSLGRRIALSPRGPVMAAERPQRLLRLADAATDGLIADRLRRAGQTDWLDWLYSREDGDEPIHSD